eukprot:jgi/Undpi1/882/HiC_scaffold_10.g04346.m1
MLTERAKVPCSSGSAVCATRLVMDDELVCALCKGAENAANNITQQKLVVNNKCGHRFHQACAEKELLRRKTFPCPVCQIQVRRAGLTEKTLDELEVARDITVRKRITKIFNRSEEDFEGDLQAYNDYLEHREDIIYGLCSGVKEEISQAQAKVQQYEDGHRDEITKNAAKKVDQENLVEEQLAALRQQQESRKHYNQLEEARKQQHKRKLKLEAQEVALGERDHVTATLGDNLYVDNLEGLDEDGNPRENGSTPAALPPGMRQMLNIPAPVPQPKSNQDTRRRFASMSVSERRPRMQKAAAAPDRALGGKRNWEEMLGSLFYR